MITYAELLALSVFVGMGCYISYLRYKLTTSEQKRYFLETVIVDVCEGNVTIRRERDGFSIHKTERQTVGKV
jgi:hypothetical protein